MPTILISVISRQTIPNLLLIKELKGKYDEQLFITTHEMEGKGNILKGRSRWLERAAGITEGSIKRIVVIEDSWLDIKQKLAELVTDNETKYTVNLTGGTKVMTLAVFEFFAKPRNVIYYVPFPKNEYSELFPNIAAKPLMFRFSCTLSQYLAAHGLYYTCNAEPVMSFGDTEVFFERVKSFDFNLSEVPEIQAAHTMTSPALKTYFSGGWFEEFIYHFIKTGFKLNDSRIAMNVSLFRDPDDTESDNEYDLLFVWKNALFVFEDKSSVGKNIKDNMDRYMHKLGAITKDFGLKVHAYVFTLSNIRNEKGKLPEKIEKRQKILGIKAIFDKTDFNNPPQIINALKKLNYE